MTGRRLLTSVAVALTVVSAVRAQSVDLTEAPLANRCFRIELTLDLTGKITVQQQGETVSFPQQADARHIYVERVLQANGGVADKTVRSYEKAEATIAFNKQPGSKRALRPERAFMVAHHGKDQMLVWSPKGGLSREEKELTEHFDSLCVSGLVPGKTVAVGDSWKLSAPVALALCDMEALTDHDLTCKLDEVKGDLAYVSVNGTASGIAQGAQVKLLVSALCKFDTKEKRVVAVEWKQSDQRMQGPVSPAMSADVVVQLKRTPIAEPAELSDVALVQIPAEPSAELLNLHYSDPRGRYEFQHGRDWHVVSPANNPQLVLRLMDRGDFIAQATITSWKKAELKATLSLEQFCEAMKTTPGWKEEELIEKTELKEPRGHAVYRLTASGTLDDVKTVQSFYLVASPEGEQMIVSFSVVPSQVQKLGGRDFELVRGITFKK
jgi:hypothetical protein